MRRDRTPAGRRSRAAIAVIAGAALAVAALAPTALAADPQVLLVHGYGFSAAGKDCNGATWRNALAYYQRAGGRERSSIRTIGYYTGDQGRCDIILGDGLATNSKPIEDIAKDLANYIHASYTSRGQPVNIIGHSMGGLIVRVALLGSAKGWPGFPGKLLVDNVVTLSTPHQGVANPAARDDVQWKQMSAGSSFLRMLGQKGSGLRDEWANGTDWSLVGSLEDTTVKFASAIDKGKYADQKYGYHDDSGDGGEVSHSGIRSIYAGAFTLQYWHAWGGHPPHLTKRGWSPLRTAFQAAITDGDGLPR